MIMSTKKDQHSTSKRPISEVYTDDESSYNRHSFSPPTLIKRPKSQDCLDGFSLQRSSEVLTKRYSYIFNGIRNKNLLNPNMVNSRGSSLKASHSFCFRTLQPTPSRISLHHSQSLHRKRSGSPNTRWGSTHHRASNRSLNKRTGSFILHDKGYSAKQKIRRLNSETLERSKPNLSRTYSTLSTRSCYRVQRNAPMRHASFKVVSSKVSKVKRSVSSVTLCKWSEVAVGRKPSNVSQKRPQRRSSEPFLLDPLTIQNKWGRKYSTVTRTYGRRRVSTTATLPTSSKQKLQALAKDELLASLNVPLSRPDLTDVSSVEKVEDLSEHEKINDQKKEEDKQRRENKRMMIIEEILETEKNYISCLETLNIVFRTQLENSNIITVKDLMSLFPSHLHEIKVSHTWFMKELEDRMHHENWRGIIGDIFAKMTSASANLLEIYTCYVNAFPKSISTLSKCTRSSQKFRKFLEDCYENPLVERLDLPSFLLSPVQRLPRYILLLRELLKYTNEDHPDHYFIGEAMKEMECLISSLNDSIQSSMEFYSASEGRRKKMSRQFTSKKRKQRTSQTNRSKRMQPLNETRSTDADQGYCSFSEKKDESPEDDTQNPRKSRSSTWRGGVSKRSMSMISSSSEENKAATANNALSSNSNNGNITRRKTDFGRNSDTRKSWRRSLGAVFSQIWSKEENGSRDTHPRRESTSSTYKSADGLEKINITVTDKSKSEDDIWQNNGTINEMNLNHDNIDGRLSKRKSSVRNSAQSQDSDSIQDISNLIRNSSLDQSQTSAVSIAVSSMNSSTASIERRASIGSNNSTNSLKSPGSPQFFKRDKLRGSAGPAFKSIFNKSKLNKKTLSWDELNIERSNSQPQIDRKQKRYSISIRRPKLTKQENIKDLRPIVMEKSASSNNVNDDTQSNSSNDTISSRTGSQSHSKDDLDHEMNGDTNNNNPSYNSNRSTKEKKHKFIKTLKSFVGKTK